MWSVNRLNNMNLENYKKLQEIKPDQKSFVKALFLFHFILFFIFFMIIGLFYKPEFFSFVRSLKDLNLNTKIFYVFIFIILYFVSIIIHEFIHGYFFSKYAHSGWKNVRFGFSKELLAPYATCSEPITVNQYKIVALMPSIVLGIIPLIAFIFTKNTYLLIYGFFMLFAGIGDFYIVWIIRKLSGKQFIIDHPKQLGYILVDNFNNNDLESIKNKLLEFTVTEVKEKQGNKKLLGFALFILGFLSALIIKKILK